MGNAGREPETRNGGKKMIEYITAFAIGAGGYCSIELMWRGFTHWSMALAGGGCLCFIYYLVRNYPAAALWKRAAAGSLLITLTELIVGFIVNMRLGWGVWDYSELPLNLYGQISLVYTVLWFLLCIPANGVCRAIRRAFS